MFSLILLTLFMSQLIFCNNNHDVSCDHVTLAMNFETLTNNVMIHVLSMLSVSLSSLPVLHDNYIY